MPSVRIIPAGLGYLVTIWKIFSETGNIFSPAYTQGSRRLLNYSCCLKKNIHISAPTLFVILKCLVKRHFSFFEGWGSYKQ